jgi:hypothetical protein
MMPDKEAANALRPRARQPHGRARHPASGRRRSDQSQRSGLKETELMSRRLVIV